MLRAILVGVSLVYLVACSEQTNFNQIFISNKQKESLSYLLDRAQISYDRGDFEEALDYAQDAHDVSPFNEDINILLGYIHLSLAGMDSFNIARGLMTATTDSDTKAKEESSGSLSLAGSSDASSFFEKLAAILEIERSDLTKLGKVSKDEDLAKFKDYEIIIPSNATKARASGIDLFENVNAAISYVCPFVDEDVKQPKLDKRHDKDHCSATEMNRQSSVKAHFLWAFAHIAEAVAFYSVVLYKDAGESTPNIQKRANALEDSADSLAISEYVEHVVSLSETVDATFDSSNKDSQFNALVNDLTVASLAFSAIGQMPYKVKRSLTKAISSIKDNKDKVSGGNDGEKEANSLKNQLNKKMADQIETQLDDLQDSDPDGFDENKDELCDAYATISGSSSLPSSCK